MGIINFAIDKNYIVSSKGKKYTIKFPKTSQFKDYIFLFPKRFTKESHKGKNEIELLFSTDYSFLIFKPKNNEKEPFKLLSAKNFINDSFSWKLEKQELEDEEMIE